MQLEHWLTFSINIYFFNCSVSPGKIVVRKYLIIFPSRTRMTCIMISKLTYQRSRDHASSVAEEQTLFTAKSEDHGTASPRPASHILLSLFSETAKPSQVNSHFLFFFSVIWLSFHSCCFKKCGFFI